MDMDFNDDLVGGYSLNYPEILKQTEIMAVTKLLAHRLMDNPYLVVGDYIKELSDGDLAALNDAIGEQHFEDIILLSEMLATGEGCDPSKDMEEFNHRTNTMISFLTIESLHRKGLVKVHHNNLSFAPDMDKSIIVEKIDGLDYGSIIDGLE